MRKIYLVVGTLLITAGLAGFAIDRPVFGVFEVNALHHVVHIATGALTLAAAARGIGPMRTWGRLFGAIYAALGVIGAARPDLFGLMQVNAPDNLLHFASALAFLYVGLLAPPRL